jgi:hypothetical protein
MSTNRPDKNHWNLLANEIGAEVPPEPAEAADAANEAAAAPPPKPTVVAADWADKRDQKPKAPTKGPSDWAQLAATLGLAPDPADETPSPTGAFLEELPQHDADGGYSSASTQRSERRERTSREDRGRSEQRSTREERGDESEERPAPRRAQGRAPAPPAYDDLFHAQSAANSESKAPPRLEESQRPPGPQGLSAFLDDPGELPPPAAARRDADEFDDAAPDEAPAAGGEDPRPRRRRRGRRGRRGERDAREPTMGESQGASAGDEVDMPTDEVAAGDEPFGSRDESENVDEIGLGPARSPQSPRSADEERGSRGGRSRRGRRNGPRRDAPMERGPAPAIDKRDIDPRDADFDDEDEVKAADTLDIDPRDIDPRDIDPRDVTGSEDRDLGRAPRGPGDERRPRRRRRRRGARGAEGDVRSEPRSNEPRSNEPRAAGGPRRGDDVRARAPRAGSELDDERDEDLDDVLNGADDLDLIGEDVPLDRATQRARPAHLDQDDGGDELDDGDDEGEDGIRMHHRNIPSWDEAIGSIIEINMAARAKSPQPHSSRGRGGRGGQRRGGRGRNDRR